MEIGIIKKLRLHITLNPERYENWSNNVSSTSTTQVVIFIVIEVERYALLDKPPVTRNTSQTMNTDNPVVITEQYSLITCQLRIIQDFVVDMGINMNDQ